MRWREAAPQWLDAAGLVSRIAAAVLVGYVFAWGGSALGAALLAGFGVARSEAVLAFSMLGFVIYLVAALWAFAARRVWMAWLALAGGGAVMTGLGRLLVRMS